MAGYLCVRRWGLAVAIGGALPIVWLAASTLFDLTDTPGRPGVRQPGRRRDRAARRDDHRRQRGAWRSASSPSVAAAYDQGVERERPLGQQLPWRDATDRAAIPTTPPASCPRSWRRWRQPTTARRSHMGATSSPRSSKSVVRDVFEHPTAACFPVTSGTAANALSLSALCPPWGSVLCHETAHILNSECGSTSLLGGGAAIRGIPGADFRISPDALAGRARRRSVGAIPITRNRRCCRSRNRPTWARSTRSTRSPASSPIAKTAGCASTSTGPASPTPWSRSAARPPT